MHSYNGRGERQGQQAYEWLMAASNITLYS